MDSNCYLCEVADPAPQGFRVKVHLYALEVKHGAIPLTE